MNFAQFNVFFYPTEYWSLIRNIYLLTIADLPIKTNALLFTDLITVTIVSITLRNPFNFIKMQCTFKSCNFNTKCFMSIQKTPYSLYNSVF